MIDRTNEPTDTNDGATRARDGSISNLSFAILLIAFAGAMVPLGLQIHDRFVIPAYGDDPEALAPLRAADPRSLSGDDLTSLRSDDMAFAELVANLDWRLNVMFDEGDGHFERPFRAADESSYGSNADGLGPVYNAASCESCHMSDGRTEPLPGQGLLVRLSVPGQSETGGPKPHPVYGGQFGDVAVPGVPPEGTVEIEYEEVPGRYGDGTLYTLLKPRIALDNLAHGPLGEETMLSARAPLSVFGLGLLEAISEETLRDWADPDDADGDGISGRINMVWDAEAQALRPGRFGWKAEQPTLVGQAAGAAHNDMGVSSVLHPAQPCTAAQAECRAARTGADPEIPHEISRQALEELRAYLAFLSVPARGHLDEPTVQRGETLFAEIGCASCHKPQAVTGDDHEWRRLRDKTIQPFTDLLLHDMGEGLSDGRPSFAAEGREWRTAPLWGIGLLERVNGHMRLLHDGRARGLAEAILWHGGEAEAARERFRLMQAEERAAILDYLRSL